MSLLLQDNKEYVKFSVCEFWRREVTLLGHVVTTEGVLVDFQGAEVIRKWKQPITISKVCDLLGLNGYYRHSIEGFSKLALP